VGRARPPPAATTSAAPAGDAAPTSRVPGAASFGNLVGNWSFEQDLTGWQVVGAGGTAQASKAGTATTLPGLRWRRIFVAQSVAAAGTDLDLEVTADAVPAGAALIYLGKSPNSTKEADLAEVVKLVRSVKPKLARFTSDTYIDELAAGETWLAQGWSGDVFQAQDQNANVSYVIPKEGSLRFVEVMCIPKGPPHPGNAAQKLRKWQAAYDQVVTA
jgi:hypothetical protein